MDLVKIHPPFVHFAIAFPVFMLITDLYYRVSKKKLDNMHALLTYISVLAVLLGTVSGIIAHEPIEEKLLRVPSLFSRDIGSEIQKPLAVVVIGGIFTSTMLTLLILPLVYEKFGIIIQRK